MRKQLVVSIKDLRFVTLACKTCNTRVTLDMGLELRHQGSPFSVPPECPRCHREFGPNVPRSILDLQGVYKALEGLGDTVSFTGDDRAELESV